MMRISSDRRRAPTWGVVLAVAAAGVALAAAEHPPETDAAERARAVVEATVDDVLRILAKTDWSVDRRVDAIEKIAYERFDFRTISRLVLARSYRKFSKEQRESFEAEFKRHLSHSYGSRVDRYEQEKVDILSTRVEKRGDVSVRTRIAGGSADGIEIHYRLRERNGVWRMIDVVIEGVSLVSSYRSQFKELLSQGGPEELLKRLRGRNEAVGADADDSGDLG